MSGLEQEFPGAVRAHNVDATLPEAKTAIEDLGFSNHGLVIHSPGGEVLFKQADHTVEMDQVRQRLDELVE